MQTFYKMTPFANVEGHRLVELTLRTESRFVVSMDKFHEICDFIESEFVFRGMALRLKQLLDSDTWIPTDFLGSVSTDFAELIPAPGESPVTFDMISYIERAFSLEVNARIEGSCPATFLVMGIGDGALRIPVNDRNLPLIVVEMEKVIAENPEDNAATVAGLVIGAAAVGIEAWRLFREEQDRARERQEREAKQRERMEREIRCREIRRDSSGGPAARDVGERIGRVA